MSVCERCVESDLFALAHLSDGTLGGGGLVDREGRARESGDQ